MKQTIFIAALLFSLSASSQNYIQTQEGKIITAEFHFRTPEFYYYTLNDTVFKMARVEGVRYFGEITTLSGATAWDDLYTFTKKGNNAQQLYLTSFLMGLGSVALILADVSDFGLILSGGAMVISISGFITSISAWKYGERAGIKMSAIEQ